MDRYRPASRRAGAAPGAEGDAPPGRHQLSFFFARGRAVVAAAVGLAPRTEVVGRAQLGGGARLDVDPFWAALGGDAHAGASADRDGYPRRSEARIGEGDADSPGRDAVAISASPGGLAGERAVGVVGEVTRVWETVGEEGRLEQARVVAPHHLGGRDGGQIGRALVLAARAERLPEREKHDRPGEQGGEDGEHQQRRLTPLAPKSPPPMSAWRHKAAPSPRACYSSRLERDRSTTRSQPPAPGWRPRPAMTLQVIPAT